MIHKIPKNDLKPHSESCDCGCCPIVDFVEGRIMVIHNSYDKREIREQVRSQKFPTKYMNFQKILN